MKKGVHKFRTKQDGKLLQMIADGITQLYTWDRIRTEVKVPQVYTFTYKNKDYTLEKGTGKNLGLYLLNKTQPVAVLRSELHTLYNHLRVFRDREELLDYMEEAGSHLSTKLVSGDGINKDPSKHFGPKDIRPAKHLYTYEDGRIVRKK